MSLNALEFVKVGDKDVCDYYSTASTYSKAIASNTVFAATRRHGSFPMSFSTDNSGEQLLNDVF